MLADRNADDPNLPDVPQLIILYGQLLYIARVTLPATMEVSLNEKCDVLLGLVQLCKDAVGDASNRPVWYKRMGNMMAVNISTIQCAVGRIKVGKRWGILDLNYGCASTMFIDDEEDGDNE